MISKKPGQLVDRGIAWLIGAFARHITEVAQHTTSIAHLALRLLLKRVHRVADGLAELVVIVLPIGDAISHAFHSLIYFLLNHFADRI